MKRLTLIAALSLTLVACSKSTIPATCEGIATGLDLAVKYEAKISDTQWRVIKEVRDQTDPICRADVQPSNKEAVATILHSSADKLTNILETVGVAK